MYLRNIFLLNLFVSLIMSQEQLGSDIDGEVASDNSGICVSLDSDGDRVAIGAIGNDGGGNNAGHVRIYSWNGSSWSQLGSDIDGEAAGDYSGFSVSLDSDGDRVVIGAYNNDGNGTSAGHARIYSWNGSSWNQLGSDIDGEAASDNSGVSVSLDSDGDRVAIGAYLNDGNGTSAGHARIYSWDGSSWNQLGSDIDGEAASDASGYSVSLDSDGDRVAIGAYQNDGNGSDAGHVRIYSWDGSSWNQLGSDIDGEAAYDRSGYSVSLDSDGDRVAIGAYNNDGNGTNAGHVRVYEYSGGSWSRLGNDIDGEAANDYSGWSVSLDSDGDRVAIGAYNNDGNGSNAGHARIYSWDGSSWNQLGSDIDGEAANDRSAYFVSLDSYGDRVVIGAYSNDGSYSDAGHVRVYNAFGVKISGNAGFRMLSAPVSNGTYSDLLSELWTQGMTGSDAPEASGDNVWTWTVGSGGAGSWSVVSNLGATMTAGAGILVYAFADNNNDGTDDLPVTLSVSGTESSGDVRYPSGSGTIEDDRYGFAGNPYYQTIDWDDVAKSGVRSTVYIHDDAKSGGAGYISWNGSSGDVTNGLIAPFQGFVVHSLGIGAYINIQEADKSSSVGTFYRMVDGANDGSSFLEFTTADGGYSKSWLSFRQDGEVGQDDRDANRLMPLMASSRLVSLTHNGENSLDINNVPFEHEGTISIPLDVMSLTLEDNNYVTGTSEVSMSWNLDNLPDHIDLTLVDNLTGEMVYLNNEMSHTFTTEPKGSFSATYEEAVGIYPLLGDARFSLQVSYGVLDNAPVKVIPKDYALSPVYPNPFNPSATVRFDVPEVSRVELQVYDVTGKLVETLLDDKMTAGQHQYTWQPQELATGTYFLRLITANQTFTQKVTYVK